MTSEETPAGQLELACERLGDLAAAASRDVGRSPDPRAWSRIEAQLGGAKRRARYRFYAVAIAAAAACTVGWLVLRQPLRYRTQACAFADHHVRALGRGSVVFEDGTTLGLEPGAGLRIDPRTFGRGAELALDEGAVDVAVVHHHRRHWTLLAGPFRVDVTGTRFWVRWTKSDGRFHLALREGAVRVSGGPIPSETRLHAGQVLEAEAGHFTIEEARSAGAGATIHDSDANSPSAVPPAWTTPAKPAAAPGERNAIGSRRLPIRRVAETSLGTSTVGKAGAAPPATASTEPALTPAIGTSTAPTAVAPPAPSPPAAFAPPANQETAGPRPVTIARDGQLSGGMSGYAWLSSGDGAVSSISVPTPEHARLQPIDGKLCTQGRLARWSCVNEGLPSVRCNWDRNWGVAIGFFVASGEGPWGSAAPSAIAVDFHGRSAKYRLNFHRKGDPPEKSFCIEGYKSGQLARPWHAKSRCWDDAGEVLPDFHSVDQVDLRLPSGFEYIAFHYCISGITLYP